MDFGLSYFKKSNHNIYEILVLLSFILGEAFIILGVFIFLATIFHSQVTAVVGTLIYFIYIIWGIAQFLEKKSY